MQINNRLQISLQPMKLGGATANNTPTKGTTEKETLPYLEDEELREETLQQFKSVVVKGDMPTIYLPPRD